MAYKAIWRSRILFVRKKVGKMKISTKGRYGLRAIVDLAMHAYEESSTLSSIASRQGVSMSYLEQTFARLKKAGIVESIKGARGGYKLAYAPEDITVLEILEILEGKLSVVEINEEESLLSSYIREEVWDKVDESIGTFISRITIADLVNETKQTNNYEALMFYI